MKCHYSFPDFFYGFLPKKMYFTEAWKKLDDLARNNPDLDLLSSEMKNCILEDSWSTIEPLVASQPSKMEISESTDDLAAKVINSNTPVSSASSASADNTSSKPTASSVSAKINSATPVSSSTVKPADKPLLRRKSDLPTDVYTQQALESHKRADDYLPTPPDASKA